MAAADGRQLAGRPGTIAGVVCRLGGRPARGRTSATQIVREYGLSQAIGPVSYSGPPAGHPALPGPRGYSEHTQRLVDQEVAALLTNAETRARDLLTRHRHALTQLTATLLEQETVTGDQVRAIARAATPADPPAGPLAPGPAGTPASLPAGTPASLPAGTPASGQRP